MRHYTAVVYATGAQTDKSLGIPGEDLPGSWAATEFVAWYNGHPDYRDLAPDLSHETAVVIGKFLGMVNRTHMRVTGRLHDKREHSTWNRSMRGERRSTNDHGVLEQVMLISVGCALVVFGIWFFAFAGSSLPS